MVNIPNVFWGRNTKLYIPPQQEVAILKALDSLRVYHCLKIVLFWILCRFRHQVKPNFEKFKFPHLSFLMTRLGNLLHFGRLFKAFGDNYSAQIAHILDNFCIVVEIFHFSSEIILGNFLLVTLRLKQLFEMDFNLCGRLF